VDESVTTNTDFILFFMSESAKVGNSFLDMLTFVSILMCIPCI